VFFAASIKKTSDLHNNLMRHSQSNYSAPVGIVFRKIFV
jgi:hypothetical protein